MPPVTATTKPAQRLDTFFAPGSIALIGASRDQEKIPGRLLSMLRKNEFPGKIYPINPNYGDIDGLKVSRRRHVRPDGHGWIWWHHHGIISGRDLSARAGQCGRG